uniref:Uncharacterized protein n=1 Tax=Cajanus cajan TaxID=3821 RepID=A0A151SBH5_CAJCA|nr:hypothetical protein KK1_026013 [Cajanus cajan]
MLTNQLRHATPGLGIALVAFGIYLVGEQVYNNLYASPPSHVRNSQFTVISILFSIRLALTLALFAGQIREPPLKVFDFDFDFDSIVAF